MQNLDGAGSKYEASSKSECDFVLCVHYFLP